MSLEERVTALEESERRAWRAIEALAGKEAKVDDSLTLLIEAQIRTEERFSQTDAQMAETGRLLREQMAETRQLLRETDARGLERSRQLDERIEKLVIAIGEFLRRNGKDRN